MSPTLLLQSHRAALLAMIGANDAAHVDRPGRFALDGLSERARRYVGQLEHELKTPAGIVASLWGENGKAPTIRAMVREADRMREMSAVRVEQAA